MSGSNKSRGLNILIIGELSVVSNALALIAGMEDGGGVRGLSPLMILSEIVNRLRGSDERMSRRPCRYFDVIAGTGTGGVIACMLGRMQMSIEDATKAYIKLANTAFSEQKLSGGTAFKGTKLQEALRTMVHDATQNQNESMRSADSSNRCKSMVFAMLERNMTATIPTIFRSYPVAANAGPDCYIWEALYATMAHPDLLKPIHITDGSMHQSFVGGDVGCSNPTVHVLAEVKRVYSDGQVSCILSIGAGHPRIVQLQDPSLSQRILGTQTMKAMKDMARDSERVAEEMAGRFEEVPGVYCRLNVGQGMQDMKDGDVGRLGDIAAHTKCYIAMNETNRMMDRMVQNVKHREGVVAVTHIDGRVKAMSSKHVPFVSFGRCPAPSPAYTGRKDQIRQVGTCITGGNRERRVCVVYGLGGAGKTQLALKAIEQCRDCWVHVLYIDASTKDAIELTLQDFAKAKKIGDTYEVALSWLEQCRDPWLVAFDNADDPSLGIQSYFPGSDHGSILITTRLRDLDVYAKGPGSVCRISSMSERDAFALLLRLGRRQPETLKEDERMAATLLLQDLGCLALAVVQAGAYIGHSRDLSIAEYREVYLDRRESILEQYVSLKVKVDQYTRTVRTTWEMCYDLLAKDGKSRPMLGLLAFLHHDHITEAMFKRAAIAMQTYEPWIPPTELETVAYDYVCTFLSGFLDSNGRWNSMLFSEVMNELASCSLIEYDQINSAYSIHVLVQGWVRSVVQQPRQLALESTATLVAQSVARDGSIESRLFNRGLGLHIGRVVAAQLGRTGASHGKVFAEVYDESGQWREAEKMWLQVKARAEQQLGEEHPDTLTTMHNLASTYSSQGRWSEAEPLQLQVMDAQKRLLGEEHPDTLSTMHNLTSTYSSQGRWGEAESLQLQVMDANKRILGEEHPHTLTAMHNLASTYSFQGRWSEAESLQLQVMDANKRILGAEHPHTLTAMHTLASTYSFQGRWSEAESLQLQVMNARKRILGEEHPDTLTTMHNLALTYSSQGRWSEAESLELQVMDANKRILGEEHPHTLSTMHNLASTYSSQGRWSEAESLQLQVMDANKRILGEEHPDTLTTMRNLASTYSSQGRWSEAESLELQVMDANKRLLGEEHPDTLTTMHNLALTYSSQGRWSEAESLQLQVMDANKRILGEEHPHTLTTMHTLASTYSDQGRWSEAESLELQVMDARKRQLGEEHPHTLAAVHNLASTYSSQGRWSEAESLQLRVMNAKKRILGEEHPSTLITMHNLALTYKSQGRWSEAKSLLTHVVNASKQVLGAEHPDTRRGIEDLAGIARTRRRHMLFPRIFPSLSF